VIVHGPPHLPAKRSTPMPWTDTWIFLSVMRASGCSLKMIRGPRRHKSVSAARAVTMWLLRNVAGYSFPQIGILLGGKDHSSVMTACKVVECQLRHGGGKAELLLEALFQMTKGK
jgi:chromosomal replication initiation ATPase DnaA